MVRFTHPTDCGRDDANSRNNPFSGGEALYPIDGVKLTRYNSLCSRKYVLPVKISLAVARFQATAGILRKDPDRCTSADRRRG